jgi:hypothetical protein
MSRVVDVEQKLRAALQDARANGLELVYFAPMELAPDGKATAVCVLNALLPTRHRLGSTPALCAAASGILDVSECVARAISDGWDCAGSEHLLPEWSGLGWRLHVEFSPRCAGRAYTDVGIRQINIARARSGAGRHLGRRRVAMGKNGHHSNICGGAGVTHAAHLWHWYDGRIALLLRASGEGTFRFVSGFTTVERARGAAELLSTLTHEHVAALYDRCKDAPAELMAVSSPCDLSST